jgi:hypothetical protein
VHPVSGSCLIADAVWEHSCCPLGEAVADRSGGTSTDSVHQSGERLGRAEWRVTFDDRAVNGPCERRCFSRGVRWVTSRPPVAFA